MSNQVHELSAGGIVYRKKQDGSDWELCIIHALGGTAWQIPKGHLEPGETLEQTAVREVREETGLTSTVTAPLGQTCYTFTRLKEGRVIHITKTVHFYLMKYHAGSTDDHDDEVISAKWHSPEDARAKLSFPNEKNLVDKAVELLRHPQSPA